MKKLNLLFILAYTLNVSAIELPSYEAKYRFESDEITINGIRKFKKNSDDYEIEFQASNLFASMYFSSLFLFEDSKVVPLTYDIKIKPKFLKRDQYIEFDRVENKIISSGSNIWSVNTDINHLIMDPLNVQIMIRTLIKAGNKEFDLKIIDMQKGGYKDYKFQILGSENCIYNQEEHICIVLERTREESNRKVTYFLMEKYEYMFLKIIDSSPERKNTLSLMEILSFG